MPFSEWDALIPTLIWRGSDYPFLTCIHDGVRPVEWARDIASQLARFGNNARGVVSALMAPIFDRLSKLRSRVMVRNWKRARTGRACLRTRTCGSSRSSTTTDSVGRCGNAAARLVLMKTYKLRSQRRGKLPRTWAKKFRVVLSGYAVASSSRSPRSRTSRRPSRQA